jgi:hypothetical protein
MRTFSKKNQTENVNDLLKGEKNNRCTWQGNAVTPITTKQKRQRGLSRTKKIRLGTRGMWHRNKRRTRNEIAGAASRGKNIGLKDVDQERKGNLHIMPQGSAFFPISCIPPAQIVSPQPR